MAAALMEVDELVEAFLLRLPPDDPASLVRAALVCKLWRRILADPGFRRRFCQRHRRPPMLGVFASLHNEDGSYFKATSSFRPRNADLRGPGAIDSRHGRVLVARSISFDQMLQSNLAVSDPTSGDCLDLPKLPAPRHLIDSIRIRWNAAVLCASSPSSASARDSIDCHLGHFLVVLTMALRHGVYVFVYSSQVGTWSETASAAQDPPDLKCLNPMERSALVENALYFKIFTSLSNGGILKYDLGMQQISWINLPSNCSDSSVHTSLLTTTAYGGLGVASVESSRLHLWSGEAGPGGHFGWAPSRVIELNTMLPANTLRISLVAFLHGLDAYLVSTNDGVFIVDLEFNRVRKVYEGRCGVNVVLYMSFYSLAQQVAPRNTGEGPSAIVPSAWRAQFCGQRM